MTKNIKEVINKVKSVTSIICKLVGIPKTFDEFVSKIKKKGHNEVNVTIVSYNEDLCGGRALTYTHAIGVQAGKTKLKLNKHTYIRTGNLSASIIGKAKVGQDALKEAIEIAEKLKGLGFEATICDISIDEAREDLPKYDKIIEKQKAAAHT